MTNIEKLKMMELFKKIKKLKELVTIGQSQYQKMNYDKKAEFTRLLRSLNINDLINI